MNNFERTINQMVKEGALPRSAAEALKEVPEGVATEPGKRAEVVVFEEEVPHYYKCRLCDSEHYRGFKVKRWTEGEPYKKLPRIDIPILTCVSCEGVLHNMDKHELVDFFISVVKGEIKI